MWTETKEAARDRMRAARKDPARAERMRAGDRARSRRAPTRSVAVIRRWRQQNPEKVAAHNAVRRAIRSGLLVRQLCEKGPEGCGPGVVHAHHDDYEKPLDVRWLCARHHAAERTT